jgi:hypothetical protein
MRSFRHAPLLLSALVACTLPAPAARPVPTTATNAPSRPSAPSPSAPAPDVERIPDADRVRLAEAFRLSDAVGERLWPGWNRAPFAVLLVTATREYLIRHPAPTSDFVPIGTDSMLRSDVFVRPRTFPTTLLATFPAVGGVPTIVVGQSAATGRRTTNWVLTVLHEHFHQMQMSHPEYQARIAALDLANGDESGQWMLSFPFPYDSAPVAARYSALADMLTKELIAQSPGGGTPAQARIARARAALQASLPANAYRYLAFQMWQEGIARYTELRCAQLAAEDFSASAAVRAMPDFTTYAVEAAALQREITTGAVSDLTRERRIAFYPVGAALGLWFDRVRPDWHARYFSVPLSLDALMP